MVFAKDQAAIHRLIALPSVPQEERDLSELWRCSPGVENWDEFRLLNSAYCMPPYMNFFNSFGSSAS